MKNEGIFGLTSLLFPKKEILWIGPEDETPAPQLKPILSRVRFVTFGEIDKLNHKSSFNTVVLSVECGRGVPREVSEALARLPAIRKVLLIKGKPDQALSPEVGKLLVMASRFFLVPEELEDAVVYIGNTSTKPDIVESTGRGQADVERKVAKTKSLVKFVQELTRVQSVDNLIELLNEEVRVFQRLKEPILAFERTHRELLLVFFQGPQVVEKVVPGVWPQKMKIRLNDLNDSQYLANIFGRPFGKLLTIPLQLKRKSSEEQLKVSAVLFFEHALGEESLGDFVEFIEERLQSISLTLDRLLLQQDLNEASLLWERTFDGLQDPIVIFDAESQILRANKAFLDNLSDVDAADLFKPVLRHGERFYEVHSYRISLGAEDRSTNVIHHYVDVTLAHRLRKQMVQNEKMAALGHLAGHIAHELNNPLTGVRSLAQILTEETKDRPTLRGDLVEVERAAERCQVIIKNLLEFSSGGVESRRVDVSVNEIVNRTLPLLNTLLKKFEVRVDLSSEPCLVYVEPHLMQQVVFNIVKNAGQAMGESGVLTISSRCTSGDGKSWVELEISDTGPGIDGEIREQIFDFFFTTKSPGQGTGLGLSMSKSIVDKFNGQILVDSRKDVGTRFTIRLPQAEGAQK